MEISRRAFAPGLLLALAGGAAVAQTAPAPWVVPDDAAIAKVLADRIDVQEQGVGIVVGVIDAKGRRIVSHGALAKGDPRPLDGDTVFEIGSQTKVFTSLILSDMVRKGEVQLDDPVQKYLPAEVKVPERGGKQITLIDLATHSSGLPGMPSNFAPKDGLNPFADYTVEQLWQFLNGYTLPRDIGAKYEYSNLGVGLLGQALARRAGTDYETLVRTRVTGPLGLKDTVVTLTPALKARLAQGHTATAQPTPNWDLPTLAGAGALRSTTNDMLTFLADELGFKSSPLAPAMAAQLVPRRPGPNANLEMALGWHISKFPTGEVIWHNGGTGGYRTFFGFDPKAKVGVVVMTNMTNITGGDDIGFHLLAGRPLMTLKPPAPPRTSVTLPADQLAGLVGVYRFAPAATLTVTQKGGQLLAQLTGQSAFEIYPESPTQFFWRVVDAQVTFERGPDGRATGLVLHQLGRDQKATRVEP